MILLDFSAVIFASLHADIKGGQTPQADYIRHLTINTIRAYNAKFKHQFGEMFIILDNVSWRKSWFPLYKYSRQWERLKNPDQDWDEIWDIFASITEEIKENLPYPVLGVQYCEADDIIGYISKNTDEECVIVSNDKDFGELCGGNIKQYRPSAGEYFEVEDTNRFKYELIMKGDKADGIPNVRCPDDFFMAQCIQKDGGWKPERAAPISKKFLDEYWNVYNTGTEEEIEKAFGEEMYANFKRNRFLISLDHIPEILCDRIKECLNNINRNNMTKLIGYFQKNNMHLLAKNLSDFTPTVKRKPSGILFKGDS